MGSFCLDHPPLKNGKDQTQHIRSHSSDVIQPDRLRPRPYTSPRSVINTAILPIVIRLPTDTYYERKYFYTRNASFC